MNQTLLTLLLAQLLSLLSMMQCCEDVEISPIDIEVEGLALNCNSDDIFCYADIPSEGCSFTVTSTNPKYYDYSTLFRVVCQSDTIEVCELNSPRNPEFSGYEEGAWGSVTYITSTTPYKIRVDVSPNPSDSTRVLDFFFGTTTDLRVIQLNQSPVSE